MQCLCCCLASVVGHKTEQRLGWGRPTRAERINTISLDLQKVPHCLKRILSFEVDVGKKYFSQYMQPLQ